MIRSLQIFHVIEGSSRGKTKLVGKPTTYVIEGITASDIENDLVILKVSASNVQPLPLGDSDAVQPGDTVYVSGNPKESKGTFSEGTISGRREVNSQTSTADDSPNFTRRQRRPCAK